LYNSGADLVKNRDREGNLLKFGMLIEKLNIIIFKTGAKLDFFSYGGHLEIQDGHQLHKFNMMHDQININKSN
jgi:hypothetical protein